MSNIDKHAVQAVADLKAGYTLGHADVAILNELARIAQASLEAEPVALRDERSGSGGISKKPGFNDLPHGAPLYTAHPAPVSVPDERYQHLSELYHAQEKRLFKLAQRIKGPSFDKYAYSPSQAIDVLESAIFGERKDEDCRAAMLQGADGNSPVIPDCSCGTCRPVTFTDSRFVVCSECGNKRCPHAIDHRNACTGSNEPGQEGSAYPAAPQQEVK
ncbi:hypothetical protein [Escherichia coli]|uniref:hypothetical protein n=1 Tax=Escherichia coli TaxID=562 RepID=UPI000CF01EF0|nr:hypothetical protein [Escherichia coli]MCA7591443.1 hypothetical protein [Escherichia coli]PPW00996.1 hypothetical protein C5O88_12470 [Escherichia coli]PPW95599.1 hypothetical protein C5P04_10545 [Escherichia coli]